LIKYTASIFGIYNFSYGGRMGKKYHIVIFDENNLVEMKKRKVSLGFIQFLMLSLVVYVLISSVSFYFLSKLYSGRSTMLSYKTENESLKQQIEGYNSQLDRIRMKIASADKLKRKFINITKDYKYRTDKVQMGLGGHELPVDENLSNIKNRKERSYLIELSNTLASLSTELDKRMIELGELANLLEERKLLMDSTPSIWPLKVKGWITSGFGYRRSPFNGGRVFHAGLDIAERRGTPIRSTAKGVVIFKGRKTGYGNVIIIDHGYGYVTKYAHCHKLLKKVGDRVEKGDIIALVGNTGRSTGPHVHYEVLVNNIPVNPMKFIVDDEGLTARVLNN